MSSFQNNQPKQWMWVFIILSIIVLGAYFFNLGPFKKVETLELHSPGAELVDIRENNATVNDYVNFIAQDVKKMSLDHDFSNQALLKLSAAIRSMSEDIGYKVPIDHDAADGCADQITIDPN